MSGPHIKEIGAYVAPRTGTVPAAVAAGTRNGAGFSRLGFMSCVLVAQTGAVAGAPTAQSLDAKLQHSADNAAFTDYVPPSGVAADGAINAITAADSVGRKNIDLSGAKEYIRVVETAAFTGGTAPTVGASSQVMLGGARSLPAV